MKQLLRNEWHSRNTWLCNNLKLEEYEIRKKLPTLVFWGFLFFVFFTFWIEGSKVVILYKYCIYIILWFIRGMISFEKLQLPKHSAVCAYTHKHPLLFRQHTLCKMIYHFLFYAHSSSLSQSLFTLRLHSPGRCHQAHHPGDALLVMTFISHLNLFTNFRTSKIILRYFEEYYSLKLIFSLAKLIVFLSFMPWSSWDLNRFWGTFINCI